MNADRHVGRNRILDHCNKLDHLLESRRVEVLHGNVFLIDPSGLQNRAIRPVFGQGNKNSDSLLIEVSDILFQGTVSTGERHRRQLPLHDPGETLRGINRPSLGDP